jgi:signal transduction histidine kinase
MLKYSGNTHLAFDSMDLCALISDLETELQHQIPDSIKLVFRCPDEPTFIEGDYEQLHQVVRNMALNSAEAIGDEAGRIEISAGICNCTSQELRDNYLKESHPAGEYAFIKVEDDGCGIPDDDYERLFDPFFTTKFTGRGLGLAAVQGIVRSHNGVIRVHSIPDHGTSFEVLFPVFKRIDTEPEGPDFSGIL